MVKSTTLFGGVWAVTATSVAIVKYPQQEEEALEEGEIETLDPRDFTAKWGETPFAAKYPNYFAATTLANKKFWEGRFNEKRGDKDKIEVKDYNNHTIEIVSALDDPDHRKEGLSLVSFCRGGYSAKAIFDPHNEWVFRHSQNNTYWNIGHLELWSLCSVFGSKPETLCDDHIDEDKPGPYLRGRLGREIHESLVRTDVSHDFWHIREQEWQVTDVRDSKYFGNRKKSRHTIKDLCNAAYSKVATNEDDVNTPSHITIAKYCRLEWTWS